VWSGAPCGDRVGDRRCPDPVEERAFTPPLPRARPLVPCAIVEGALALRTRKNSAPAHALPPPLDTVTLHAAGVAVGATAHWVAVPAGDDPQPVRRFGATTADLEALADWGGAWGPTTVALASPGVSWIPLCEGLAARGFQGLLVDPGTRPRNGRPTSDVPDGQWLPRLPPYGGLSACCRPEDHVVVWRSSVRQRAALLADAARDIPHRQQALTQRHVTLHHGVSAMTGVTGLAISKAILAGERDPQPVAPCRDPRGTHDTAALAHALSGPWRAAPLGAFQPALARSAFQHRHLAAGDDRRAAQFQPCVDRRQGEP